MTCDSLHLAFGNDGLGRPFVSHTTNLWYIAAARHCRNSVSDEWDLERLFEIRMFECTGYMKAVTNVKGVTFAPFRKPKLAQASTASDHSKPPIQEILNIQLPCFPRLQCVRTTGDLRIASHKRLREFWLRVVSSDGFHRQWLDPKKGC